MDKEAFKLIISNEAKAFIADLPEDVSYKIKYNIRRIMLGERNSELFKKLESTDIWEFRTLYNKMAYRLFAFWDKEEETMVIITHGIKKKTQKTPRKEIEKAMEMMKLYFENKKR